MDLWDIYADYINGKREIAEINAQMTGTFSGTSISGSDEGEIRGGDYERRSRLYDLWNNHCFTAGYSGKSEYIFRHVTGGMNERII